MIHEAIWTHTALDAEDRVSSRCCWPRMLLIWISLQLRLLTSFDWCHLCYHLSQEPGTVMSRSCPADGESVVDMTSKLLDQVWPILIPRATLALFVTFIWKSAQGRAITDSGDLSLVFWWWKERWNRHQLRPSQRIQLCVRTWIVVHEYSWPDGMSLKLDCNLGAWCVMHSTRILFADDCLSLSGLRICHYM